MKDLHFNNPLEIVSVTVKDNSSGEILGTDSTDVSGNYSVDYTIVSVNENVTTPDNYHLSNAYPNPFNPSTKIDFSTPRLGKFTARIYNIIGQLVYSKDFTIDAGNHAFAISGLGSAGVYLFNLSSDDFSSTQKLVLLDGGSGNINVELTGSISARLNKTAYDDLLIEFRKAGYSPFDSVVVWDLNLTVDAELQQISGSDSLLIAGHITRIPTNTDAIGVTIRTYAGTQLIAVSSTNNGGNYSYYINYGYYVDPEDPNNIIYVPSEIRVALSGTNYHERDSIFTIDGNDITWNTYIDQQAIVKQATISGNVKDSVTQQNLNGVSVNVYKEDNDSLLIGVTTNVIGNYSGTYNFMGYDGDPQGVFNNIGQLKVVFSKTEYNNFDTTLTFQQSVSVNALLYKPPYIVNSTIRLYNTKGDIITDLDSLIFSWPDGSVESIPNVNGMVILNKQLYALNSDTTAIINHNRPELYLKWFMGTTNNPDKVDLIYQNPGPGQNTVAKVPLNQVNNKTTELYLIPKQAKYGINNDLFIDMDGSIVTGFLSRGPFHIVSGFRPSLYDTTDVVQLLYNETTGDPIAQNQIDRALNEIQKFFDAVDAWSHKKLLNYRFTQIESSNNPFYLYLTNSNGRNWDNVSQSDFYQGGPLNVVNISLDGTFRIRRSFSKYGINSSTGQIIEEVFDSMLNTNIDGASYIASSNISGVPYTDLARNLIGISLIMKPGTYYWE